MLYRICIDTRIVKRRNIRLRREQDLPEFRQLHVRDSIIFKELILILYHHHINISTLATQSDFEYFGCNLNCVVLRLCLQLRRNRCQNWESERKAPWHTAQPMHVFWAHREEPYQMAASANHPFHLPKESCRSTIVQLQYVQGRKESDRSQENCNKNRKQLQLLPLSLLTWSMSCRISEG